MEERIAQSERDLEAKRGALQDSAVVKDGRRLEQIYREMEEAQKTVDELYARWAEIEQKIG